MNNLRNVSDTIKSNDILETFFDNFNIIWTKHEVKDIINDIIKTVTKKDILMARGVIKKGKKK